MENKYEYIVNTSKDFITLINKDYIYELVNLSYEKIIGKPQNEILHHSVAEVWGDGIFQTKLKSFLDKCFTGEEVHYIDKFKFGLEIKYVHVSYYPYLNEESEITHALVFTHDITQLGKIESKLINYEYRDPLTGLFNRKSMDIILEMELEQAKRSETENLRAVLFIDIYNLKEINQKFGFEIGKILLENTGLRIREALRDSDFTFCFMGTELAVILTRLSKKTDTAKVAAKLINIIESPYHHNKHNIKVKSRIGISIFPIDGSDNSELINKAVSASREAGLKNCSYMLFDEELNKESIRKLIMESELTAAFQNNEFILYYQPIVNNKGIIRGAEALIRWNHPKNGMVSPLDFIPLAEDTGLIEEIGKWVIFTATRQLRDWIKDHDIYVSLNLCAREFSNKELSSIIKHALESANNLDPRFLKLEITESEGIKNPKEFIKQITELRSIGIEIFIDDFGTGQSSLEYLKSIPADVLKIDRSFVNNIENDEEDLNFLRTIVDMIKSRNKKIVVEGINSKNQAEILNSMGCDRFQGFYFSKPLPADKFKNLLVKGKSLP
ncbi:MAG: EAL domain-containing protein [Spirochaetia bacterium]|jgi:diguanylate cyclase (GGDEF)-like protein/PAS domain S-box-containing protein|nr:EAL domain-containing protein [Spirochaetia bacterium]